MKLTLAAIIALASLVNVLLYWDTPAAYGWAVAFSGWIVFALDKGSQHGDS